MRRMRFLAQLTGEKSTVPTEIANQQQDLADSLDVQTWVEKVGSGLRSGQIVHTRRHHRPGWVGRSERNFYNAWRELHRGDVLW